MRAVREHVILCDERLLSACLLTGRGGDYPAPLDVRSGTVQVTQCRIVSRITGSTLCGMAGRHYALSPRKSHKHDLVVATV